MFKQAVTTVAVGKRYYLNLGYNLLKSFLLWNKNSSIQFVLFTDNASYFKEFENYHQVNIVVLNIEESDKSFTSKFLVFDHIMADKNLFIDCDCLIYGSLDHVFERFEHCDFSAIGKPITQGDFFCDVSSIIKNYKLISLPWFVGSVYFFKNSAITKQVIAKARELKNQYDELGFVRLRGKENEEPLLAVAMSIYDQHTIADDGLIKSDLMFYDEFSSNIITGKAILTNNSPSKTNGKELSVVSPMIVHFNDSFSETVEYLAEEYRLKHLQQNRYLTAIYILFKLKAKSRIIKMTKDILRPLFHKIVGPMKVKKNKRVAD